MAPNRKRKDVWTFVKWMVQNLLPLSFPPHPLSYYFNYIYIIYNKTRARVVTNDNKANNVTSVITEVTIRQVSAGPLLCYESVYIFEFGKEKGKPFRPPSKLNDVNYYRLNSEWMNILPRSVHTVVSVMAVLPSLRV